MKEHAASLTSGRQPSSLGLCQLGTGNNDIPFFALRFFNESRDIGMFGVYARDQAAQRTPDLLAYLRGLFRHRSTRAAIGRIVKTDAHLFFGERNSDFVSD